VYFNAIFFILKPKSEIKNSRPNPLVRVADKHKNEVDVNQMWDYVGYIFRNLHHELIIEWFHCAQNLVRCKQDLINFEWIVIGILNLLKKYVELNHFFF